MSKRVGSKPAGGASDSKVVVRTMPLNFLTMYRTDPAKSLLSGLAFILVEIKLSPARSGNHRKMNLNRPIKSGAEGRQGLPRENLPPELHRTRHAADQQAHALLSW